MRTTTIARGLVVASALAGLTLMGANAASATDPPAGYPGTIEKLDWPKGTIVKPVPPPTSGPKEEGPLPEFPDTGDGDGDRTDPPK